MVFYTNWKNNKFMTLIPLQSMHVLKCLNANEIWNAKTLSYIIVFKVTFVSLVNWNINNKDPITYINENLF